MLEEPTIRQPLPHHRHHSHHHRCLRSLVPTTAAMHRSRSLMSSSQDEAHKRETDTKAPPSSDHISGVPPERLRWPDLDGWCAAAKQQCHEKGQRQPQSLPSFVTAQKPRHDPHPISHPNSAARHPSSAPASPPTTTTIEAAPSTKKELRDPPQPIAP